MVQRSPGGDRLLVQAIQVQNAAEALRRPAVPFERPG